MKTITIIINEATEEDGYYYDIFDRDPRDVSEDIESIDGGFCTRNLYSAIGMASKQAQEIVGRAMDAEVMAKRESLKNA